MSDLLMTQALIHYNDVHLRRENRTILEGTSFTVVQGETVVLMGPSGSGKTTVLRTIAGLEPFDRGSITVDNVAVPNGTISSTILKNLRRKIGMVFQSHELFGHLSALDNVALAPAHVHGHAPHEAKHRALEWLRRLGVEHRAHAFPRELSGGESQRVAIARALVVDPPILLMDEPTASLDAERRKDLVELIRSLTDRQRTLIISTHDELFAEGLATRVLRIFK